MQGFHDRGLTAIRTEVRGAWSREFRAYVALWALTCVATVALTASTPVWASQLDPEYPSLWRTIHWGLLGASALCGLVMLGLTFWDSSPALVPTWHWLDPGYDIEDHHPYELEHRAHRLALSDSEHGRKLRDQVHRAVHDLEQAE